MASVHYRAQNINLKLIMHLGIGYDEGLFKRKICMVCTMIHCFQNWGKVRLLK